MVGQIVRALGAEEVDNAMLQPFSNLAGSDAGPARVGRARDGHLALLVALDVAQVVQVLRNTRLPPIW